MQDAVAASAAALRRDVARAKSPLTGVSAHPYLGDAEIAVLPDATAPIPAGGDFRPMRISEPFETLRGRARATAPACFWPP